MLTLMNIALLSMQDHAIISCIFLFWEYSFLTFLSSDLFIQKLPRILLYVSFIQVGGQTHQTYLRQAKVSQLDVTHWGNQEAENRNSKVKWKLDLL